MLIPIVPSVPKRRRGHTACPVVDLMDLGSIFGMGGRRVRGDGCVVHLGLDVVLGLGDDRERGV